LNRFRSSPGIRQFTFLLMGVIASSAVWPFSRKVCPYPTWNVDDAKAAAPPDPRIGLEPGADAPSDCGRIHCGICLRYYSKINVTTCCRHQICSGCLISMREVNLMRSCPFCNKSSLAIAADVGFDDLVNPENQDDESYTNSRAERCLLAASV
jgi:hypothetical protein